MLFLFVFKRLRDRTGPGEFFIRVLESHGISSVREWEPWNSLSKLDYLMWSLLTSQYCPSVSPLCSVCDRELHRWLWVGGCNGACRRRQVSVAKISRLLARA